MSSIATLQPIPADPSAEPAPLTALPSLPHLIGPYVGPAPDNVDDFLKLAAALSTGRTAVPLPYQRRPGDTAALMLRAHGMNIPIGVGLDHIYVVAGGRTGLTAQLMTAILRRAGIVIRIKTLTDQVCELTFHEGRRKIGASSYTIREAAKLKLTQHTWWQAVPEDCLFARAVSRAVRRFFTHIVAFGYTREEIYEDLARGGQLDEPAPVAAEVLDLLKSAEIATPDGIRGTLRPYARKHKLHATVLPDGRTVDAALIEAWHHAVTRERAEAADQSLADAVDADQDSTPPACTCDPVRVAEAGQHEDGCDDRTPVSV